VQNFVILWSNDDDPYNIVVGVPKVESGGAPPLGVGAWLNPTNKPLPMWVAMPNLIDVGRKIRAS